MLYSINLLYLHRKIEIFAITRETKLKKSSWKIFVIWVSQNFGGYFHLISTPFHKLIIAFECIRLVSCYTFGGIIYAIHAFLLEFTITLLWWAQSIWIHFGWVIFNHCNFNRWSWAWLSDHLIKALRLGLKYSTKILVYLRGWT